MIKRTTKLKNNPTRATLTKAEPLKVEPAKIEAAKPAPAKAEAASKPSPVKGLPKAHLELVKPEAKSVFVAGSFNEWNPANLRAEALNALGAWANPNGRDRITGLWRPVNARTGDAARAALSSKLSDPIKPKLTSLSPAIQIATIRATRQLRLKDLSQNFWFATRATEPATIKQSKA